MKRKRRDGIIMKYEDTIGMLVKPKDSGRHKKRCVYYDNNDCLYNCCECRGSSYCVHYSEDKTIFSKNDVVNDILNEMNNKK